MLNENNDLLNRHVVVLSGKDTMLKGNFYEIQCSNSIIAVDKDLWNSWTGIRYMNGEEYHGPVYVMGTQKTYNGTRSCSCSTCQKDCFIKSLLN